MNKTAGHVLRMSGLAIEMLGVWGVFRSGGAQDGAKVSLPGGTSVSLAWIAVGLGFVLWMTGTLVVYGARRSRKVRGIDAE